MGIANNTDSKVSDVCQINEVDHLLAVLALFLLVSDVCQINEVDHCRTFRKSIVVVSDVCQINEVDHDLPITS